MKRFLLLLSVLFLTVTVPVAPARADDDAVPIDFFYDALSPYGDWLYVQNYGYVWQPLQAQQSNWAPYSDGYWAYTDAGWTWVSNEDFGWATYHYGRWIRLQQNWVWVPGYEWAPAWVSWRQTQGQIGWAPLPPEANWVPNIGFGEWTDSYYDVGPAYYNFVPINAFASSSSLSPYIMDRSRNFSYYDQSVNITHISYQQNVVNNIFVGGPDPTRIDRFGGNQVRRLTLRRDDAQFGRAWRNRVGERPNGMGNLSRVERDQFIVAAPSIRRGSAQGLPPRVRERLNQPDIDHGWRGAADQQNTTQIRARQREELAKNRPQNLPDKNWQPATSTTPPPAFGRPLQPDERIGAAQRHDPRRMTEEVRPATAMPGNGRPGASGPMAGTPPSSNSNSPPDEVARREDQPPSQRGRNPGDAGGLRPNGAPVRPAASSLPNRENGPPAVPQPPVAPTAPVPPQQSIPKQLHGRPELPGNRQQRPENVRREHPQLPQPGAAQPKVNKPVPIPQPVQPPPQSHPMPQPSRPPPQARPMPAPHNNPPATPTPHVAPPGNPAAQGPGNREKKHGGR